MAIPNASKLFVGSSSVSRVYAGAQLVWTTSTAPPAVPSMQFDVIGDSLVASYNEPTKQQDVAASPTVTMAMLSGQRLRQRFQRGVPGQTTGQMAARFASDIVAHAPQAVVILGGTNDSANAVPVSTFLANIDQMVQAALAAGIRPFVIKPPPKGAGEPAGAHALLAAYSAALDGYTAATVLDGYTALKDGSGYLPAALTSDGVHLTAAGKWAVGQAAAAGLAGLLDPIPLSTTGSPAGSLFPAGTDHLFAAGSAGWTIWNGGNPPAGVSTSFTPAAAGRAWRWTFTSYADWNVLATVKLDMGKIVAGDRVRIAFRLDKSAGSAPALTLYSTGIFGTEIGKPLYDLGGGDFKGTASNAVFATEFTVPPGATNVELVLFTNKADPGSWFELSQMTANKI